jgi:hypothetical protein
MPEPKKTRRVGLHNLTLDTFQRLLLRDVLRYVIEHPEPHPFYVDEVEDLLQKVDPT